MLQVPCGGRTVVGFRLVARGTGDLKTRYRPQRLDEVCPTFNLKDAQAILDDPNASQVWLFEGVTGCGKTSLARIISMGISCEANDGRPCLKCQPCKDFRTSYDIVEVNGADLRGIDEMRRITEPLRTYPNQLKKRILILDEAQQITRPAQELLNKALEEPNDTTVIFLCTTNKKGLIRTLLDRCAKIAFRRLKFADSVSIAEQICSDNKVEPPDAKVYEDMFRRADGSIRAYLNLLELFIRGTYTIGSETTDEEVSEGAPDIFKLVKGLIEKNWPAVRDILATENVKNDPDGYRETVCSFLARDALKAEFATPKMSIAKTLSLLSGSLWEEPKREQYSTFVLRCMRVCARKE